MLVAAEVMLKTFIKGYFLGTLIGLLYTFHIYTVYYIRTEQSFKYNSQRDTLTSSTFAA